MRLASQLQREFLPRELPELGGISFRAMFRPAGYVSGDIYDVQRVDEEHIAFFIADAVGHGVPAALLTMYIKSALHVKEVVPGSTSRYEIVSPDKVLQRLNVNMCRQEGGKVRFATACFGVINCETMKMTISRAGHPLPMLFRANDDFETVDPEGPLLGVFPEAEFQNVDVQLAPGDRMLLYSDGFELAFDKKQGIEYEDRLKELAHGSMDQAIAGMSKLLDRQAGSLHQEDDLTLLLIGAEDPVQISDEEMTGIRQRKPKNSSKSSQTIQ